MIPFDQNQAEWSSRMIYPDGAKTPWLPDKWVVHYGGGRNTAGDTAGRTPTAQIAEEQRVLRAWQSFHIDRKGWQDIAYNYAVGQSGTRYRLRGENRSGATKGDYDRDGYPENHEARAVVFILGGDQEPTPAALASFESMWLTDPMPVIGHRDVYLEGIGGTSTACPGDFLASWIDQIGENVFTPVEISILKRIASRASQDRTGSDEVFEDDWDWALANGVFTAASKPTDMAPKQELAAIARRIATDGQSLADVYEQLGELRSKIGLPAGTRFTAEVVE